MYSLKNRYILNLISAAIKRQSLLKTINRIQQGRTISATINNSKYATVLCSNLEICKRYKHKDNKKGKKASVTESEDESEPEGIGSDDWDSELVGKQSKLLTVRVNSLRADLVLKAGLGIARNKIENMFYESKIRVNGQKLLKKAAMLSVGDEVDIVRGTSLSNPNFLTVSRVEILAASERGDGLSIKIRRNKTLTIDNYKDDPHKS